MKDKKTIMRGAAVLAIMLVVFTTVVMAVPFVKNNVFWLAYAFAVIAFCVQGYAAYAWIIKDGKVRSKLYGFPIARIGTIYLIVQLALSLLFMALAKFAPLRLLLVLSVVTLGAAGIGLITAEATRDEIERQDVVLKKGVSTMRTLQSKARTLVGLCADDEIAAAELRKLSEELQYSDPVSNSATTGLEAELTVLLSETERAVVDADHAAVTALCKKAMVALAERNRLCKLNKG